MLLISVVMDCGVLLSIVSIVVSCVALFFTALPIYKKFMSKKEVILLVVSEKKIENDSIKLSVVYFNDVYRDVLISNSFISLNNKKNIGNFTYDNKESVERWIVPIVLEGKKHAAVQLEYKVDWNIVQSGEVDIYVETDYISSVGKKCHDSFLCGHLSITEMGHRIIEMKHIIHQLDKQEDLYSCST